MVGGEAPFDFLGSGSRVRVTEEMLEDFFFLGTCIFSAKESKDTSQVYFNHRGEKNNSLHGFLTQVSKMDP